MSTFLFAHGAGKGSESDWMLAWDQRLSTLGRVVRFDYPYMAAGRRAPDRLPKLLKAHGEALAAVQADHPGPYYLIGKSMGSRVGCHLAANRPVAGVICLGYPLTAMGKRDKLRDEVLLQLPTPILFVQGTRDRLCPLDLLQGVRERMGVPNALHVVEAGDHSLKVTKRWCRETGLTQADADQGAFEAIKTFVEAHRGGQ